MTDKLKPCPFCGGEAEIHEECVNLEGSYTVVFCRECNGEGAAQSNKLPGAEGRAIAAWNRRHTPPGYVLVPEEPTDAMVKAACTTECVDCYNDCRCGPYAKYYRAMIDEAKREAAE